MNVSCFSRTETYLRHSISDLNLRGQTEWPQAGGVAPTADSAIVTLPLPSKSASPMNNNVLVLYLTPRFSLSLWSAVLCSPSLYWQTQLLLWLQDNWSGRTTAQASQSRGLQSPKTLMKSISFFLLINKKGPSGSGFSNSSLKANFFLL